MFFEILDFSSGVPDFYKKLSNKIIFVLMQSASGQRIDVSTPNVV
jgi:hypothetical protein